MRKPSLASGCFQILHIWIAWLCRASGAYGAFLRVMRAVRLSVGSASVLLSLFGGALGENTVREKRPKRAWCSYERVGRFGVKSSETDGSFPEISSSGQVALAR
jgi:hypothetical protein